MAYGRTRLRVSRPLFASEKTEIERFRARVKRRSWAAMNKSNSRHASSVTWWMSKRFYNSRPFIW